MLPEKDIYKRMQLCLKISLFNGSEALFKVFVSKMVRQRVNTQHLMRESTGDKKEKRAKGRNYHTFLMTSALTSIPSSFRALG